jgi:uncharacterized protein
VSATVRGLERAGRIVDAAVAAGANQVYGPALTFSDARGQYAAAVDAALDDARVRAEAIAEGAGLRLGPPLSIVDGGSGVGIMPALEKSAAVTAAADVPVEPGTQMSPRP